MATINILPHFTSSRCIALASKEQLPKRGFGTQVKKKEKHQSLSKNGDNSGKKAVLIKGDSAELKSVLKEVEKGGSKTPTRKLHIDPKVAAKGKVDFVRVESWGEGESPEDLEQLKLKSFSPSYTAIGNKMPFYEELVRRIQLMDSKGDISVVQPKELPSFDKWAFKESRYLQFLVDQHAVYMALRDSIASVISGCSLEGFDNPAALAVANFDAALGLDRVEALEEDIRALHMVVSDLPKPTTQSVSYAKYINQIGKLATGLGESAEEARFQLLAHIFAIHVAHLTTGMRVGAKVVEHLPMLAKSGALNFYKEYPSEMKDPLKVFMLTFNKVGIILESDDQRELVMEELPKSIQKTSLMFSTLAIEES